LVLEAKGFKCRDLSEEGKQSVVWGGGAIEKETEKKKMSFQMRRSGVHLKGSPIGESVLKAEPKTDPNPYGGETSKVSVGGRAASGGGEGWS